MPPLLSVDDIRHAADTLDGKARKTPLLESPLLNQRLGCRLLIKPEMLQVTGSFKFRGAYNRISQIPKADLHHGVVAFSSGNHAQGVALAAQMMGIPARIIMPGDAPSIKIDNTRAYGAQVVFYDRATDDREALSDELTRKHRATLIRPYDDPAIIAGQGTVGLEIADELRRMKIHADLVLVPCGGGGLVAGTALTMATESPKTKVYSVEPKDFDDTARSLAAGNRLANAPDGRSMCDALLSPEPGKLTFELNRRLLAGGLAVSDFDVGNAMMCAFDDLKLISEPGGAVALAAALSGTVNTDNQTVVVVMSGGNVDAETFRDVLGAARLA